MKKGINSMIQEFRETLTNEINKSLNEGMPIMVTSLVLENLLMEVQNNAESIIQQEQKQMEEAQKSMESQVVWEDPEKESEE